MPTLLGRKLLLVLTTMSTLGYGDIVFTGNAGRLFQAVMFTGVFTIYRTSVCLLEFSSLSWSTNRSLRTEIRTNGTKHVIITNYDSISHALMDKLTQLATCSCCG